MVGILPNGLKPINYSGSYGLTGFGSSSPSGTVNSVYSNPLKTQTTGDTFTKTIPSARADSESKGLFDTSGIGRAIAPVIKDQGPATMFAQDLSKKVSNIVSEATIAIYNLKNELRSLNTNSKLSPEELKNKQETINKKIEAIKKEVEAKLEILQALANNLPKVNQLLKTMQEKNVKLEDNDIMQFFQDTLNNINPSPSKFEGNEDENTINNKIKNSVLGSNNDAKFDAKENELTAKKDEASNKLKNNLQPEEKEKLELKLTSIDIQLTIIQNLKMVANSLKS